MSENKKFNILEKIKLLKSDKVKNQALFKRGGFAIGITALVLAGIIALNLLVAVLAKRVTLEYDISPDKVNSISEDNEKFIKAVKKDVTVTVCASEENYLTYMSYLAQNNNVSASSDYYSQTLKIVEKYGNINDKISINFVDPQTSEFLQISQNYSDLHPTVGDIIVSCKVNGNDRHKLIAFNDIYTLSDPS
ncbi:MAG: GldG family protein [Clostridia bacterium]|nr:GldG family protein [Clostridia bacterium]